MTDHDPPTPPDAAEEPRGLPAAPEAEGWGGLVERAEASPLLPYLGAGGLAAVAMAALVLATTLPATGVLAVGLTYLAVAVTLRRLEDGEPAVCGIRGWLAERLEELGDRYGLEFYGTASVTAFVLTEIRSLASIDVSLADLLANPLGAAISWLVSALIESIMNAVWAALWPLRLFGVVGSPHGAATFLAVLVAAWAVWRVLDVEPLPPEPGEGPPGPARLEEPDGR